MALTKDFRETVKARADRNPTFRAGLYQEALQTMLDGDFPAGRIMLREFINATIGFPALAARVGVSDKSLMRMFEPAGNPYAANLFAVLQALTRECRLGVTVEAKLARPARPAGERVVV
jgi:DNA-binding phage protein